MENEKIFFSKKTKEMSSLNIFNGVQSRWRWWFITKVSDGEDYTIKSNYDYDENFSLIKTMMTKSMMRSAELQVNDGYDYERKKILTNDDEDSLEILLQIFMIMVIMMNF